MFLHTHPQHSRADTASLTPAPASASASLPRPWLPRSPPRQRSMISSMNRSNIAFGVGDLFTPPSAAASNLPRYFAPAISASIQRSACVLQGLRRVAVDDPLAEPSAITVLPTPATDQHRVVLRAADKSAPCANLIVPANHRVQFALPSRLGEVATIFGQRFVLAFWVLVRHLLISPGFGQSRP